MQLRPVGKSRNTTSFETKEAAGADYPWGTPPGGLDITQAFDKLMKLKAAAPEHAATIQEAMDDLLTAINDIKAKVGPMMERQRAAAGGAPPGATAPSPQVTPQG